jgi:polar amino acid transport system permease protein
MTFDWAYLSTQWPALIDGFWLTVKVSLLGILFSAIIGIVGAGIRQLKIRPLVPIIVCYVELIRNTPILVQLFFIFYGLPSVGLSLSLFWSGVLCLSLWAGAYQIENIRGGLIQYSTIWLFEAHRNSDRIQKQPTIHAEYFHFAAEKLLLPSGDWFC